MNYLQEPVTCSKFSVSVSKVNIYVDEHVSAIRMNSPYIVVYEQDKMLSHVVIVTVNPGSVFLISKFSFCCQSLSLE